MRCHRRTGTVRPPCARRGVCGAAHTSRAVPSGFAPAVCGPGAATAVRRAHEGNHSPRGRAVAQAINALLKEKEVLVKEKEALATRLKQLEETKVANGSKETDELRMAQQRVRELEPALKVRFPHGALVFAFSRGKSPPGQCWAD